VISPFPRVQVHVTEGGTQLDSRGDIRLRSQRLSSDSYPLRRDDHCPFPYAVNSPRL